MTPIDATLRGAVVGDGAETTLTLDADFQGLPDAAHGGSMLGLFDLLAARRGQRTLRARYLRRVPLGVPLMLTRTPSSDGVACRVAERGGAVLVEGGVEGEHLRSGVAEATETGVSSARGSECAPLPVSLMCFACGIENPRGLHARLTFDAATVGGVWTPHAAFRAGDGRLSPVALTTLLDEAAFWLGALASGESGMTTELTVAVHGDASAGSAVHVSGERAATRPHAADPRYWTTRVSAHDDAGRTLATASITFVAVRGAARKLVTGLLVMNPREVVRGVFPAYCA